MNWINLSEKKYHETDHRSNHYTKVIIHIFFIFRILGNSWNWELTNSHVFDAFLEHSTLAIEMIASQATHLTCLPPLCPEVWTFPLYYVWFSEEEQYLPSTYEWPPLLTDIFSHAWPSDIPQNNFYFEPLSPNWDPFSFFQSIAPL